MRWVIPFLLLMVGGVYAEPPKIDVDKEFTVSICEAKRIQPKIDLTAGIRWIIVDEAINVVTPPEEFKDGVSISIQAKKAGVYTLVLVAFNDKKESSEKRIKFTVLDGPVKPEPKKDEPVKPVDPPVVKEAKLSVVVIEETADAAITRSKFFNDKALAEKIISKGHKVIAIDKDVKDANGQVPQKLVGYLEQAKGKSLPWIVIVDAATAKILHSGVMSNDPAEVTALLTKFGG